MGLLPSPPQPSPQAKPGSSVGSDDGFLLLASQAPLAGVRRGHQEVCLLLARCPPSLRASPSPCLEVLGTLFLGSYQPSPRCPGFPLPLIPRGSKAATPRLYSSPPCCLPPNLCPHLCFVFRARTTIRHTIYFPCCLYPLGADVPGGQNLLSAYPLPYPQHPGQCRAQSQQSRSI